MLNLKDVNNISEAEIINSSYDIGIFASGYESRCVHLVSKLNINQVSNIIVFGFEEHSNNDVRLQNDIYYNKINEQPTIVSASNENEIFSKLILIFKKLKAQSNVKILIDYTSMSRLWYSGILNFVRFQTNNSIIIDLNYTLGEYKNEFLDYSYSSINSLPSHEGSLSSNNKTLLVLAIGFSPYMVKSVIEEIEPNQTIGILPIPNILQTYEAKSKMIQEDILTKDIDDWIRCPLNDLENIFRTYAELASNNLHQKDIIFLSLGPKIFTIASILVSQRFEQVTCLYIKSQNNLTEDVKATGTSICNRVTYI